MRDGDIYFWRWKDEARHKDSGPYRSYHCCSRVAVVDNGVLQDTFWACAGSNKVITADIAVLTYKGNVDEMRTIHDSEIEFFNRDDVVDMRHANSSRAPIYVRKTAKRDPERMVHAIQYRIERERSNIKWAKRRIAEFDELLARIASGQAEDVHVPM